MSNPYIFFAIYTLAMLCCGISLGLLWNGWRIKKLKTRLWYAKLGL